MEQALASELQNQIDDLNRVQIVSVSPSPMSVTDARNLRNLRDPPVKRRVSIKYVATLKDGRQIRRENLFYELDTGKLELVSTDGMEPFTPPSR